MSEENICKCEHLFDDHGYEKNENPPPHMKSPCKKCECNYFQRPGSQPHVARSIAKTAARQAEEALAVKVEQQANQRREEGRRKYAEIEAKKLEEKEKDLERIRNEYKIPNTNTMFANLIANFGGSWITSTFLELAFIVLIIEFFRNSIIPIRLF